MMLLEDAIKNDLFMRMVAQGHGKMTDAEAIDIFEMIGGTYPDELGEKVCQLCYLIIYGFNPKDIARLGDFYGECELLFATFGDQMTNYDKWRDYFFTVDVSGVRRAYALKGEKAVCAWCGYDKLADIHFMGKKFRACELCGTFWMITDIGEPLRYRLFMQDYPYCNLISVSRDDIYGGGYPDLADLKRTGSDTYWVMNVCVKFIDLWLVNKDLDKHKFPTWVLKLLDDGWEADYPMLARLKNKE